MQMGKLQVRVNGFALLEKYISETTGEESFICVACDRLYFEP